MFANFFSKSIFVNNYTQIACGVISAALYLSSSPFNVIESYLKKPKLSLSPSLPSSPLPPIKLSTSSISSKITYLEPKINKLNEIKNKVVALNNYLELTRSNSNNPQNEDIITVTTTTTTVITITNTTTKTVKRKFANTYINTTKKSNEKVENKTKTVISRPNAYNAVYETCDTTYSKSTNSNRGENFRNKPFFSTSIPILQFFW